ncbi:hypothetical protein Bbelb_333920 [Branchiostoma belcheri]|nr:hypothetical protein Bbelb_333920 [Branchiostoma belcheri]
MMQTVVQMRSTPHYVWSTADVLGQGATGSVFKGRHKKTGDLCAIKTFNQMSFMRPVDVQMREFEMVLKLKHRNIVKLLDIEEEPSTRQKVIVMEICTGGSLYTILDEPENAYGLAEEEFKLVMKDVAAGMNYLREKGIVHRDLKPGNIMRCIGEDSLSIYKLTDFGAARELDDEEQFMSLYGTEEYLHPDMYERAVLRRPMGKSFKATVDLWSIGVTFYHVATGSLPFRPYGGARRNKEIMFKITTEKPSGAISGIQHTEDGRLEWSRALPKTCLLSRGFKDLLTPLLAGILECDSVKMWSFEMFFEEVTKILNMDIIHIFNISTATSLRVYVNPTDTFASVQELVAVQTDIPAARQEMIFDSYHFAVSHTDPASTYPKTSPDNPIIVLDNVHTDFSRAEYRELPKLPRFGTSFSLDNDAPLAKVCASVVFDCQRSTASLLLQQNIMRKAVKWFICVMSRETEQLRTDTHLLGIKVTHSDLALRRLLDEHSLHSKMLDLLCSGTSSSDVQRKRHELQQLVDGKREFMQKILDEYANCEKQMKWVEERILVEETLKELWKDKDTVGTQEKDRRQKLSANCIKAVSAYADEFVPKFKHLYSEVARWFQKAFLYRQKLAKVVNLLDKVSTASDQMAGNLQQSVQKHHVIMNSLLSSDPLQRPVTSQTPPCDVTPPVSAPPSSVQKHHVIMNSLLSSDPLQRPVTSQTPPCDVTPPASAPPSVAASEPLSQTEVVQLQASVRAVREEIRLSIAEAEESTKLLRQLGGLGLENGIHVEDVAHG